MKRAQETELGWVWRGSLPGWLRFLSGRLVRGASGGEPETRRVGRWGEWLAMRHVRRLGWQLVARNWTTKRGEVDLIAYDGDCLVFIEVKTRRQGPEAIPPEESVDSRKLGKLEDLALEFLGRCELTDQAIRFDVIAIETPDLNRFELRHSVNVADWP